MTDRIAAFIDGPNLYHSVQSLGFDIDLSRLFQFIKQQGTLLRTFYYTEDVPSAQTLLDWLDYRGVVVRTKPDKERDVGEDRRKSKRAWAVI